MLHVLGSARIVGSAEELMGGFTEEREALKRRGKFTKPAQDIALSRRLVDAGGVEQDEFLESFWILSTEVEEDAPAVAMAESDGVFRQVFVCPGDVILYSPDFIAGRGKAGDVKHFSLDALLFEEGESLSPGFNRISPAVNDIKSLH